MNQWEKSVFVNCPYDKNYLKLLRHIVFTLSVMGFSVQMALDNNNNSISRIVVIEKLIRECRYSIHDISYMQASKRKEFARMNMPFELGIDYGYRQFVHNEKVLLILEQKKYNYHRSISDLSGMDICCHNNKEIDIIKCIRDWVSGFTGIILPGEKAFWNLYYYDFLWFVHENEDKWQLDENNIFNSIPCFRQVTQRFIENMDKSKREKFVAINDLSGDR